MSQAAMAVADAREPMDMPDTITLNEVGLYLGLRRFHVALFCCLLFMSMQYWANVQALPFVEGDIGQEFGLSDSAIALVSLATLGGSAIGVQVVGCACDAAGRRAVAMASSIALCTLGLLHTQIPSSSQGVSRLFALRFLIGIPYGGLMVVIPAYLLEFAADSSRGLLLGLLGLSWNIGSILSIQVFRRWGETLGWRGVMAVVPMPSFVLAMMLLLFMPESPRWLMMKGFGEDAQKVYDSIFTSPPVYGAAPVGRAPRVVAFEDRSKHGTMQQVTRPTDLDFGQAIKKHAYLVAVCALLYILLAGSHNAIWFWERRLLDDAAGGAVGTEAYQYTDMLGIPVVVLCALIVDIAGRRPILFALGMAQAAQFSMYAVGVRRDVAIGTWVVVQGLASGFWVVLPVYMVESFPTIVRATLAGLCFAFGRVAAIIFPPILPYFMQEPWVGHAVLAFCSLAFSCATLLMPRENSGRAVSDA